MMDRRVLIVLISFSLIQAATPQEDFLRANELYAHQEFQKAFDVYEAIEKKGPGTWYNMGNAAYHLGKEQDALVYWQRAARMGTGSLVRDALDNYAQVSARLGKHTVWLPHAQALIVSVPLWIWQCMTIIFCMLFVIFVALFYIRSYTLLLSVSMPAIVAMIACLVSFNFYEPLAITKGETVSLYTGPDEQFHVVDTLSGGKPIRLLRADKEGWVKGTVGSRVGWVKQDTVTVV